jgi:hypothetical protein
MTRKSSPLSELFENYWLAFYRLYEERVLMQMTMMMGVRKRSEKTFYGRPLWDIAYGPNPEKNEIFGHARGIIALGDIATGWIAIGRLAIGIIAIGGLGVGIFSVGGLSVGLLLAIGGMAIGGLAIGGLAVGGIALGGLAIGYVAMGGGAIGYYAMGGGAWGEHIISGGSSRSHTISTAVKDPQAVEFFSRWIPGVRRLFGN